MMSTFLHRFFQSAFWSRCRRRPLTTLFVASLLVHAMLLLVFSPFAVSRMRFDLTENEQRVAEVEERQRQRQEQEDARRAELTLPEEHREDLKEQVQRRHEQKMREQVEKMLRTRELALQQREEALEKIHQREQQEIVRDAIIEPLKEALKDTQRRVDDFVKAADQEVKTEAMIAADDRAQQLADEIREKLTALEERLTQSASDPQGQTREDLQKISELAGSLETLGHEERRRDGPRDRRGPRPAAALSAEGREIAQAAQQALENFSQLAEFNDTSTAAQIADVPPAAKESAVRADVADLYEAAVELEKQVAEVSRDTRAAEQALRTHSTFQEAQANITDRPPERPDLASSLRGNKLQSVAELNQFREDIKSADGQVQSMASRTQSLTGQMDQMLSRHREEGSLASSAIASAMGAGKSHGGGDSSGGKEIEGQAAELGSSGLAGPAQARLSEKEISAQALPGRMFTEQSSRQGWLYLDTWYVIGPWESNARKSFERPHPPEQVIDFDAEYHDGAFAGQDGHPDQVLRWRFLQSDRIRIQPHRVYGSSTYFFYTEVHFDRAREMVVSIAADDAAQTWVNGEKQVSRGGKTSYRLGELLLPITFQQGFNTVLVRLENYPGPSMFSVLLCPADQIQRQMRNR